MSQLLDEDANVDKISFEKEVKKIHIIFRPKNSNVLTYIFYIPISWVMELKWRLVTHATLRSFFTASAEQNDSFVFQVVKEKAECTEAFSRVLLLLLKKVFVLKTRKIWGIFRPPWLKVVTESRTILRHNQLSSRPT